MAYQLSCSDYLYLVDRNGELKPIAGYTSPVFLYQIYKKYGDAGLVEYEYLNGPAVPVYVRRDRICGAIEILDQSLWEAVTEVEETPSSSPEWDKAVIRLYRQLLKIMVEESLDDLGFAYDRVQAPVAVLIVNGRTYIHGECPGEEQLTSSDAINAIIEDLPTVKNILDKLLRKVVGRGFQIEESIEKWRPGFCR